MKIDQIKNKCIDTIKNDNNSIFTWLNNGDIKSMYKNRNNYIYEE